MTEEPNSTALRVESRRQQPHAPAAVSGQTSWGQRITAQFLRAMVGDDYVENFRPDWLFGMELDFYFERLGLAVEFNGDQHHHYTAFGAPQCQQRRDKAKRAICRERGIALVSIKAIDLQIGSMRAKLKRAVGKKNLTKISNALKRASTEAVAYRKTLIASFDSPTARRGGSKPHKQAVAKSKQLYKPSAT